MNKPLLPDYLKHITVVLTRPSHPANIGAAARAMKTMGLTQLRLVAPNLIATPMTPSPAAFDPLNPDLFSLPEESHILASGAKDVLENAKIYASLKEALADTTLSCALSSRKRELTAPMHTPRELAPEILSSAASDHNVALVFGNETFGLSIDEVRLCNRLMTINGNPNYFSLNLAQAVQVVSYEIFSHVNLSMDHLIETKNTATHQQITGMVDHLEDTMQSIHFFERRNSERMIRRLHRLFDRAQPEREDIDILRGFFKTIEKNIKKAKSPEKSVDPE